MGRVDACAVFDCSLRSLCVSRLEAALFVVARTPETSHQTLTELCTSPTADSIMRTVSASQFGS
jgi:hypothetical protein